MEAKLQELTKKIYEEGVEKAKTEANTILENANIEAGKIIEKAKKESQEILKKTKDDQEQLKNKVLSEIKLASGQAISTLKQNIINLLSYNSLSDGINKTVNDTNIIIEIIKLIVSKWDFKAKNIDLDLILPEKTKKDFIETFKKEAKDILDKGVELKFENRMEGGFKIGPKDGSFILSFTDKDFENFFQSFLKLKTKEILFPKE